MLHPNFGDYSFYSPFRGLSGRSHSETWAGCIVSLTTPIRSWLKASRSVSSTHPLQPPHGYRFRDHAL